MSLRARLAAAVALGASALLAVYFLTEPRRLAAGRSSTAAPPPVSADVGGAQVGASPRRLPPGLAPVDPPAGPLPVGTEIPWEQIEVVGRRPVPGSPWNDLVRDALAELRQAIEPCFRADASRPARNSAARVDEQVHGPAILVLRLESSAGRLVVAGIEVESLGYSPVELVTCCQQVLFAYELAAPRVAAGQRLRLSLMLL